ncbi:hypothetical protein IN07_11460 [Modestobacter caceresii]|uniref:Uncharacterized protein n=1 Tax=Modestobacter caceresii TaxID=1522368 RepID=A0A098YA13_9ACTN|nr:hypothetical protein IN07_11460 [Modestobacter caceresii]
MRALGYMAGAFAAVAAGLQAGKVWDLKGALLVTIVIVAAAITLMGQLFGLWNNLRRRTRATLEQDVRTYLFAMYIKVLEDAKVAPSSLGFAAYELRRRWVWQLPHKGANGKITWPWRRVLSRLDRHRATERIDTSRTVWTPGKGIIGLCVRDGRMIYADVKDLWAPLVGCTPEQWAAADEGTRMGFTHTEFKRRAAKAAVVWAMPIIRDRSNGQPEVIGCVALDGPPGALAKLEPPRAKTQRHLGDASSAIANRLRR